MTEEDVTTGSGMGTTTATTQFVMDDWNPAKSGATGLSGNSVLADLNGSGTLDDALRLGRHSRAIGGPL